MQIFNSEEDQREQIYKEDIQWYLSSCSKRSELFKILAEIIVRVEILEIYSAGSMENKTDRVEANQEYVIKRSAEIFNQLSANAPKTQIL